MGICAYEYYYHLQHFYLTQIYNTEAYTTLYYYEITSVPQFESKKCTLYNITKEQTLSTKRICFTPVICGPSPRLAMSQRNGIEALQSNQNNPNF